MIEKKCGRNTESAVCKFMPWFQPESKDSHAAPMLNHPLAGQAMIQYAYMKRPGLSPKPGTGANRFLMHLQLATTSVESPAFSLPMHANSMDRRSQAGHSAVIMAARESSC